MMIEIQQLLQSQSMRSSDEEVTARMVFLKILGVHDTADTSEHPPYRALVHSDHGVKGKLSLLNVV